MAQEETSPSEFPDIHEIVGDFGTWQKRISVIFLFVFIINVWQSMAVTFLGPSVDFWCVSPLHENVSAALNTIQDVDKFMPRTTEGMAKTTNRTTENQCTIATADNSTVPCTKWEFNQTSGVRSIVSEWNLVCDREWLVSFSKSIYMIGYMISIVVLGQLSDWFGRYPIIMLSYAIMTTATIITPFSSSYVMFVVLRFLAGFGRTGVSTTGFVLLMEIVSPKWRPKVGFVTQLGWSIGYIILPGIAYFVRDWFYLQFAISLPILLLAPMYWIVPESPRWLLTQQKWEKFDRVIEDAVKKNGNVIPDKVKKSMMEYREMHHEETKIKPKTLLDVIKTPYLRMRIPALFFIWVVNSFVYYGLSFNTNELAGNPYLNFFLSGLVEFPAIVVFIYALRKFGRRTTLSAGMIATAVFSAIIIAVPSNLVGLSVTFAMLAKLSITGTYQTVYLCTAELFPTVVRSAVLGSCSTFARIGPITAPFVRDLGRATYEYVPHVFNSVLSLIAGFLVWSLKETKDDRIPDTLEDGQKHSTKHRKGKHGATNPNYEDKRM